MCDGCMDWIDRVAEEIEAHVSDHPHASDTVSGIAEWWIGQRRFLEAEDHVEAALDRLAADLGKLAEYRNVCGFPVSGSLPVTYPHILAFPLHMEILVNPLFPFPLLGLVHVRNEITQYRAIGNQEAMDIECELVGPDEVGKGLEFSIITRVSVEGKLVWESVSTNLFRTKTSVEDKKDKK